MFVLGHFKKTEISKVCWIFQDVWAFELLKALDSPTGLFCRAWC